MVTCCAIPGNNALILTTSADGIARKKSLAQSIEDFRAAARPDNFLPRDQAIVMILQFCTDRMKPAGVPLQLPSQQKVLQTVLSEGSPAQETLSLESLIEVTAALFLPEKSARTARKRKRSEICDAYSVLHDYIISSMR